MKTSRLLPLITAGTFLTLFGPLRAQDPAAEVAATLPASGPVSKAKDFHEHHGFGDPLQVLTKKLNLSAEQQSQIKPIVEATLPVIKKIREEERAKIEGAMEVAVSEVKATLNPDQKHELDRLLARMHEHYLHHGGPGAFEHRDGNTTPDTSTSAAPAKG